MSLLDIVRVELENMDTLIEPVAETVADDHVVGEISTDLKKLYSLAIQWDKEVMENLVASRYASNREQYEVYVRKAAELHKKSELLLEIFWVSVKDSFDLWGKPSIGIRKGWRVVWGNETVPVLDVIIEEIFRRERK